MNNIIISGRIVRDLEPLYTQGGKCYVNFTLAVEKGFNDNKKTLWIYCTAWEKTAEIICSTLGKGRKILVRGELDQYESEKDGVKKTSTQIIVRDFEYMDSKQNIKNTDKKENYDVSSLGTDVFPNEDIPF